MKRQENLSGKRAFPHGLSCLFPGYASVSGLAAYRRRALGLRWCSSWLSYSVTETLPMFRTRHVSLSPLVSESAKRFASVTGNKLRFATMLCTRQDSLSLFVRRGRAAMGRQPEGLLSGERQKNPLGRELAHAPRGFLAFVLPRRLSATPKRNSGTLFEATANTVPQPRVQGIQSPGAGFGAAKAPKRRPW